MGGPVGFEVVELDPYGHATPIAVYASLQRARDELVVCDVLPTVVVVASGQPRGDTRRILDNNRFDFDVFAAVVGFDAQGASSLLPGSLYGVMLREAQWCFAHWWRLGIGEC